MNEAVSVGIICHNEEHRIAQCLDSLKYIQNKNPIEVLVVDNASNDRTVEIAEQTLAKMEIPFKILERESNNLGKARNDVFRHATHRWIYFVDADCRLDRTTWDHLMENWVDNPRIAGRGGSQRFPHDYEILILLDEMRKTYLGHFGSVQMKPPTSAKEFVEHLSTSNVLYDKKAWQVVDGFNLNLRSSAEDLDFSLRLRKHGFRLQFIPKSYVWHAQVRSWQGWARKAFRNGIWQTRLIRYNPEILMTPRPWPSVIVPTLLYFFPPIFKFCAILYFIAIFMFSFGNSLNVQRKVKLFGLFFMTHLMYGIGEICGLYLAARDFVSDKLPSSTKH